jgi:hypothetical protein
MRYVIVIVSITLFIGWEAMYGDWVITESVFNEIVRLKGRMGL